MDKSNVTSFIKTVQDAAVKHFPEILTGLGVGCMLTATVLAVAATPKALRRIEEAKENKKLARPEEEPTLTKKEVVKAAWKPYIPAAITGITGAACVIGASSVNAKRNAALATAYQLSATALSDYKEKVIETIGEKKERTVREKVAEKKLEERPVSKSEVIITGGGRTLCYDAAFGKYFESDIETIRTAVNDINEQMLTQDYVSLNDFYDKLNLSPIDIGDNLGWNIWTDRQLRVDFTSKLADDGRPCVVLQYDVAPRYDFWKHG